RNSTKITPPHAEKRKGYPVNFSKGPPVNFSKGPPVNFLFAVATRPVLLRELLQMLDVSLRTVFRRSLNVQVIGQQLVHLENELRGRRLPSLDCGVGHRIGHLRQFIESVPNNLTLQLAVTQVVLFPLVKSFPRYAALVRNFLHRL